MAIPEPSERDWAGEDGEGFLTDPEALRDRLPQPYRMVDRVLDRLLDRVWEAVLRREGPPLRRQPPLMLSAAETQLPESTNCLACSGDGRFLAAGHAQGLSVSCASSLAWVSSRLEEGLEITATQMTAVGQEAYLISTVDDMGTTLMSPLELLKKAEVGPGMGSGQNHMISGRQWKEQDAAFRSKYGYDPDQNHSAAEIRVSTLYFSLATVHFLSPCGVTAGSDVDPRPAMLWPNAHEIVCSAISQSSRYIALGLEPDLVSVWDRQTGSPLSVVVVSVGDSRLTRLVFVDCQEAPVPHARAAPRVHLVASCRSGTTHALTTGARAADTRAETLSPSVFAHLTVVLYFEWNN
ncbi:unnamed protein product [Merluccius merluccius]